MENQEELKRDLDHILEDVAKEQDITNYEINANTTMNYGDGFVAQFFRGEVKDKDTGEKIYVAIKKAPFWEFDYKAIFNNENLFYTTAMPALNSLQEEAGVAQLFNNVPKYLSGGMEPKKEYIAMEDLKEAGYVMFDKAQFFNEEHLEFIFNTYGKFHALSFVLRKQNPNKYYNIVNEFADTKAMILQFLSKQIITAVTNAVETLNNEKYKNIYDEIRDFGENAVKTFQKALEYQGDLTCLVHGDCWSNNMLFKYSEFGKLENMKLIDFQLCRNDSPIYDLAYFFYSGASRKDFENIENYLKIYYKTFFEFSKELGVSTDEIFTFDTLLKEWKENALCGILFGIWLWQIKLTSKEEVNKFMDEHKDKKLSEEEQMKAWEEFMSKMYDSEPYKEKVSAILIHAVEFGVLSNEKIVRD